MKLSAVIIAKNEEKKIRECLASITFCDEIILIDSGSSDRTNDVVHEYNVKIIHHKTSNFSELRNKGLASVSGDWILYIDADERVSKELKESILSEIKKPDYKSAYKIKRKNYYFDKYAWPKIEQLERLFHTPALQGWYGEVHESPKITGPVGVLNGYLIHKSHDDLTSMVNKTNDWSAIEARTRLKTHHPKMTWWRFPRVMLSAFWDSYIIQGGWKVGTAGLIESIFQAFSMFITYSKLWELQQKKSEK